MPSRRDIGKSIRAEMLGPDFVARDASTQSDFDAPFKELSTEFLWGAIWGRDGLDRKTRALLDIAILGALGRSEGLTIHVHVALRAGCTEREIQETLLHIGALAGISAGVEAFSKAKAAIAAFGSN